MPTAKIAITLEEETLKTLDRLVKSGIFTNRSSAIENTLSEKLAFLSREKFEKECAKLTPADEKTSTEEIYVAETKWPKY